MSAAGPAAAAAAAADPAYRFPTERLQTGGGGAAAGAATAPRCVIVSCGSFNPPSFLHLSILELARDTLVRDGWTVVGGYLSPVNDLYPKPTLISHVHRLEMCRRAVASSSWIMVDPWEALQPAYQRTLPVVEHFDRELAAALGGPVTVKLLCGQDMLDSMARPGVWIEAQLHRLLGDYGLIAVERPLASGDQPSDAPTCADVVAASPVLAEHAARITIVPQLIFNNVSSTILREFARDGRSLKYLTEDGVIDYIDAQGLYSRQRILSKPSAEAGTSSGQGSTRSSDRLRVQDF